MRVKIDMDSTLFDFEGHFLRKWRARYPDAFFVPLGERRTSRIREEYPDELREKVQAIMREPRFFADLPPIPGAIKVVADMRALGIKVGICSTPLSHGSASEKLECVDRWFGEWLVERTTLTHDKTEVRCDILIDDMPMITGAHEPVWEHVIYDQPYNRWVEGKRRLDWTNWKEVLKLA